MSSSSSVHAFTPTSLTTRHALSKPATVLALLAMLLAIFVPQGTALASGGSGSSQGQDKTCPTSEGWTKKDGKESANVLDAPASLTWSGSTGKVVYDLPAGATLDLCIKGGKNAFPSGDADADSHPANSKRTLHELTGSGEVTLKTGKKVSHVSWRYIPPPEPQCVDPFAEGFEPKDVFSHTWDADDGSGKLTLTEDLCSPLHIRATTWTYDDDATQEPGKPAWTQTYHDSNRYEVQDAGTYDFEAPKVDVCRQYDAYAAFTLDTLDLPGEPPVLNGPGDPYEPPFVHDFSSGPKTWGYDSLENCAQPDPEVDINLQKIVCPSADHVVWNADVTTDLVDQEDIPADCWAGEGWTFDLKVQGGDSVETAPTDENGLRSVAASDILGEADLDAFLGGTTLEVRENIEETDLLSFGTLRCYDDIGNEDNLEWVTLDPKDLPEEIWCVAYNIQEPEPDPDLDLNLQKLVCDAYDAIPGNRLEADPATYYANNPELDDTFEQGFLDWDDTTSLPVAKRIGLDGCAPASGWSFELSFDQDFGDGETIHEVGPTGGDHGTTSVSARDTLGDDEVARLIDGEQLWVREITQDGYNFGALQCYTDARHADNLEFIQLGQDLPDEVWCVAYNIEKGDVDVDVQAICKYLPFTGESFVILEATATHDVTVKAGGAASGTYDLIAGEPMLFKTDRLGLAVTLTWGGDGTAYEPGHAWTWLTSTRCGGEITPEKAWTNGNVDDDGYAGVTITRGSQSAQAGEEPGSIFVPYGGFYLATEDTSGDYVNISGLGLHRLDATSTDLEYLVNGGDGYTHTVVNKMKPGIDVEVEALCVYLPGDEDGFGIAAVTNPNLLLPVDVTFTEGGDGTHRVWPGTSYFALDGDATDVAIAWGGEGSLYRSGASSDSYDDAHCGVDVEPVKDWTDETIDLDPDLTLHHGEDSVGQGDALTIPFGSSYEVTEDEGDWVALEASGSAPEGLGDDFSLALEDLGLDPEALSEDDLATIAAGELTYEHLVVNDPILDVSVVDPICDADLPYLQYEASSSALDPDWVTITFINPDGDDVVYEDVALQGEVLWPGAIEHGEDDGPAWPGWDTLFDGDGNVIGFERNPDRFGWSMPDVDVVFSLNPTFETTVSYPEATPDCLSGPPAMIDLEKSATATEVVFVPDDEQDPEGPGEFGLDVTYEYVVTNIGGQTLYRLTLEDDRIDEVDDRVQAALDEALVAFDDALEPGESVTIEVAFFVEPDTFGVEPFDVDELDHTNTAVVEGFLDPEEGDDSVTATDDELVQRPQVMPQVIEREEEPDDEPEVVQVVDQEEETEEEAEVLDTQLASTGVSSLLTVLLGLLAIAAGIAAVRFGRRSDAIG